MRKTEGMVRSVPQTRLQVLPHTRSEDQRLKVPPASVATTNARQDASKENAILPDRFQPTHETTETEKKMSSVEDPDVVPTRLTKKDSRAW